MVYSYSADDLRGRVLTGSIEVAAAIDGLAITSAIEVDEDEGRGRITVVLRRRAYPDAGGHELAVTLSLSAADAGFVLGEPSSIRTRFSFGDLVVPDTVVTLSGPIPADATAIAGDELSLVYSYSADELRGRVLTGSIEVAATIDGLAITSAIEVDEDEGRGRITVVLRRRAYPDAGGHELAVILSLSAVAEGFVLGGTSLIETTFSFLPLPPTVLEVRQAEGNQGKRGAAGSDAIELGYIFEYAAGNRLNRPRAGLAVQVDVELCADAGSGCAILPGASRALILDGDGSLTLSVDRTLAALSVFGEADADSIRHGRVLLRTAGDADFAATAAATTFSFAVADTVVTLSGPVPVDATGISAEELSLVYSYSADDLHGRVLTGSIEVAAAIDGVAITPSIEVDEGQGRGEITVVLRRRAYPDSGEHELAVTLSLSAADAGFVLAEPSSIRTRFSFGDLVVPDTVVTLSGPVHDLLPADATAIAGDELSLVYSYSADDLRGRVLTGSIEVAATIDGLAITSAIEVDEDEGVGRITVVLRRRAYPDAGGHELAVILSLSAVAEGFVLGGTSLIETTFSFLPLLPTVLEVRQAQAQAENNQYNQGKPGAAGSDVIELGYSFDYAAGNRLKRPRAGLVVQVEFELCTDAGYGECSSLPAASMTLTLDDGGSLTLRVDRTAAGLSVFGEADADSIRHGRVLLRTADNADFAAAAAATTFSFAVADTVVTLSGPVPADATGISAEELSLAYSYSADDLRGRVLTGSIEVAAAIDGVAITPSIEVDEDEGVGRITVVLQRLEYPEPGEHELAVTLSLSAAAEGFVLAEPSSIRTRFSFGVLVVPDTVVTLSGPVDATGISAEELSLVYSYSADDLRGRVLTGSIEVAATIDGLAITSAIEVDEDEGVGRITVVLRRRAYPDSGEHELAVILSLSAADAGFVLAEPSSIRTRFSFGDLVVPDTVVTLSGPVHDLLPADATAIAGDELSLVYSYSADELRGRVLTGSIEVAAAIDGLAITSAIEVDEDEGVGRITVVLRRRAYPDAGEHELAVILSLSAAAEGFALGEPSLIETTFSFLPLPPTVLEVRQAQAQAENNQYNQGKPGAAGSDTIELGYIFEYAAGNRLNRPRAGLAVQVDVELCADAGSGCAILPGASQALILDGDGSLTLSVDRTLAALSVFGEADADSIRHGRVLLRTAGDADFAAMAAATTFSFAVADTVVTLSGPVPADATGISAEELSLAYSYSADDLRGRVLTGSIEVAAAIDGVAITPSIEVDEGQGRGEITVVLQRLEYPEPGEHELAVTLSLSAAAEGFVLAEPSSIRTRFSFGVLVVPDTVVTLSGPVDATGISAEELSLVYSYSADDLRGRVLTGSIEVAATIDGLAITSAIEVDEDEGVGRITVVLRRRAYPDSGEHELAVILSLSAADAGFVLAEPSSIRTRFSFGDLVVPDTVVTLSGPVHDLLPADATAIAGDELSLVYSYSADDLRGRVLTGSIEVAAAIDGLAITSAIEVDEDEGVGRITVVLRRRAYPDAGEHELAVILSLSAAAEGFALGEPSLIETTFSFLPLPPTVLEVRQAEGNQGKRGAAGSDTIELGYIFEYAAGNRLDRPRAGLAVQVDVELCADAGSGCAILPGASQALILDGDGSLTLSVDRTLAALSVFGEADADSIRHGRVLLRTAGDADFAAAAAATTFSFAVADTVVTLSGPVPVDATGISTEELSLVYSYSADDLHGRVLTGSIEVAAAIDGVAIIPSIEVDEGQGRGEITVVLQRLEYPEPGEHELAVTLSLSAVAEGFVLAEPSSIATPFSFGALVVPDTVVTLSGPGPIDTTGITGNELGLVYSYSADDLRGRALTGSIEVAAAIDGLAITSAIEVDEDEGVGRITVVLRRRAYPDAGEHELAVILSLSAAAEGFVLGEPSSIRTRFSFGALVVADADTVVILSGPDPIDTTGITGNELSLVYSYSADDLRGRALTGSIEVVAAIDGLAITSAIEVDENEGVGRITVVLLRREYPDSGEHELAVTLSLSAAAEGFVLGEPSSITTQFSFEALVVPDTVVTLSGPRPIDTTGITGNELSLVYSYSADDLRGRTLMGNVDVVASVDAVVITPAVNYVDEARGEITIILSRAEYPEPDEHKLAVTLNLSAAAEGFVLGEPSSITTPFSFGALVVADADTVVTLSGPVHDLLPADATAIAGDVLSLVYSYSADDLRGRALTGSIEVAAAIDGLAITSAIEVDEDEGVGRITVVLLRREYPEPGEHELTVTLSLSATATGFVLGGTSSISTTFGFSPIPTAINEDGTCKLGVLRPGERCLYRGSSYYLRVLEAASGPQVFFFEPNEIGEPLNLEDASNPHDNSDFRVYNLEAIREGLGYRIIRVYSAPAYQSGELSGSLDGATILLAVLFFFANLVLGLVGGPRRWLWR